jgi:hypothetical protein
VKLASRAQLAPRLRLTRSLPTRCNRRLLQVTGGRREHQAVPDRRSRAVSRAHSASPR